MKPRLRLVVLGMLIPASILPLAAFWGATGHRIVGEIGQRHLTARAQEAVAAILGSERLAQSATWPDEYRSDPRWAFADPWHYVSVDDNETLENTSRAPEGDILKALSCFEQVLRDPAAVKADQVIALRFLVHLIGDLHQPLHVGRRADRGGNSIRVELWRPTNLHSVWDSGLIENEELSYSEFVGFIDNASPFEVRGLQAGGFRDWAQESFDLRSAVYDFGDASTGSNGPRLGYGYAFLKMPIIKRRLLAAGLRVAIVLNSIFDFHGSPTPMRSHPGDEGSSLGCADLGRRLGTD